MKGRPRILEGSDDEAVLRHVEELRLGQNADFPLSAWRAAAAVKRCKAAGWLLNVNGNPVLTPAGARILGVLDGQVRPGRVDRSWPAPMPRLTWRRLHPRQQDALVMAWLFGAFELHWDGGDRVAGRRGDGRWLDVPNLIQAWDPLDLEAHLQRLGVVV